MRSIIIQKERFYTDFTISSKNLFKKENQQQHNKTKTKATENPETSTNNKNSFSSSSACSNGSKGEIA